MGLGRLLRGAVAMMLMLWGLGGCYISLSGGAPEAAQDVLTVSLSDGGLLRLGDLVEISVSLPEPKAGAEGEQVSDEPYKITILLQDEDGKEIVQRVFDYAEGDSLPPLTLDDLDLPSSRYRLTVRILQGEVLVEEKVVEFTFVGREYALREITTDAPIVHPGSTVSLTLDLDVPKGADPVLVWSAAGKTFAQGNLSQGLGTVEWTAPAAPGIYTITVSLYPLGTSTAAEDLGTAVYVAAITTPTGELGPETSYFALYHLLGDLRDAAEAGVDAAPLPAAPLKLLTRGNIVGYHLDGTGGFTVPRVLVPVMNGVLGPASVTLGFTPAEPLDAGDLFLTRSADGSFLLRLGISEDGTVFAEMVTPEATRRVDTTDQLEPGRRTEIALSLYPEPGGGADAPWTAALFLDGEVAGRDTWPTAPRSTPEGLTTVGGPTGAIGLVDELGVYYRDTAGRDAPDPGLFARAFLLEKGPGAAGEGFDGMYLASGYVATGAFSVADGLLVIPPQTRIVTPPFAIDPAGSSLRVRLTASLPPGGVARLVWDDAPDTEDAILEITGGPDVSSTSIDVTLTPEGENLRVVSSAAEATLPRGIRTSIRVVLSNLGDAGQTLEVDDLAIWPTR